MNKSRILKLLKYLYTYTDIEHAVTTGQLLEHLEKEHFPVDRHTLIRDMEVLSQEGFHIEKVPGIPNKYYLEDRTFSVAELKLLVDAVAAAKFISAKNSQKLIDKISKLTSIHHAEKLVRHLYTADPVRYDIKPIYYIVDRVTEAITQGKKIRFQYYDYNSDKKRILRNNGEVYINSPYCLILNGNFYYLVGYSEAKGKIVHFRLDRMGVPDMVEEAAYPMPESFHVETYASEMFHMFSGSQEEVVLKCDKDMMKYIIDQFGEQVETWRTEEDCFWVRAHVYISPTFYSWLFQFSGKIKIMVPEYVKQAYDQRLKTALEEK